MSALTDTIHLNKRSKFSRVVEPGYLPPNIKHELLSDAPERIETWTKQMLDGTGKVTRVLGLTVVNEEYVEKMITSKMTVPLVAFADEKIAGRGEVSLKHVVKERYEINLSYFGKIQVGKMCRVTNVKAAKETKPFLMQNCVLDELEHYLPFDDTYEDSELVVGYEAGNLVNRNLQYMEEEIIE
jgi:hypothetical protein